MAMNKAEKAEMQALRVALALRMPDYPEPRPMTRDEILASRTVEAPGRYRSTDTQMVAQGWDWNRHNLSVTVIYSDGMYHARDGFSSWSQTHGRLYRSKADALRAMRISMSKAFAEDLAKIDAQIAAETTLPNTQKEGT